MPNPAVKINEKGRRIGEDHPRAVLSDHEIDLLAGLLDEREAPVDSQDRHRAFNQRPVWQRMIIVLAGPVANLLLGAKAPVLPVVDMTAAQAAIALK